MEPSNKKIYKKDPKDTERRWIKLKKLISQYPYTYTYKKVFKR